MADDEKKPTLDEQVQEAMKRAAAGNGVMGQAMKMTNMAYAFQFAQHAVPKLKIVEGQALEATLRTIHEEKGVIISVCSENGTPHTYVVVYYAMEK